MKISYAVDNLRSIETMEPIELRPITLLVGANNSGKSTFLRSFSLFRQSIEEDTSVPILWVGKYADFGDYITSVKNMSTENEISFKFIIEDLELVESDSETDKNVKTRIEKTIKKIYYHFKIDNFECLRETKIVIDDFDICFKVVSENDKGVEYYINDKLETDYISENIVILDTMLFSIIKIAPEIVIENRDSLEKQLGISADDTIYFQFTRNLSKLIANLIDTPPKSMELSEICRVFLTLYPLNKKKFSEIVNESTNTDCVKLCESLIDHCNENFICEVNHYCSVYIVLKSILRVQDIIESYFSSTTSIGPLRAQSDRFYRLQGLNVSEISIDGNNFPMFLVLLDEEGKLEKFSDWVKKIIGYEVSISRITGHVCVFVKQNQLNVNICDSGTGISQVLPVLAQIWLNTLDESRIIKSGRNKRVSKFAIPITMEQPELHLHPWHQAELAEAFARVLRDEKIRALNPHFIIETHSEVLINKLGSLIRNGKLLHEDLQLVMFSKNANDPETTQVSTSSYDEEGILTNWPHGFFNY